ncbi:phospholipase D beta 1-like protein [Tanacetum coccineum]
MQHFYVPVALYATEVLFVVKDSGVVGSQLIGAVGIPAEHLVNDSVVKDMYNDGVGSDSELKGVPGTYFPLRSGGKVTLNQDAHVDGNLPTIKLDHGLRYVQGDCWRDICDPIRQG